MQIRSASLSPSNGPLIVRIKDPSRHMVSLLQTNAWSESKSINCDLVHLDSSFTGTGRLPCGVPMFGLPEVRIYENELIVETRG